MKTYLFCLMTGATLLASIQVYAFSTETYSVPTHPECQKYDINSPEWAECMIDEGVCSRTPDGDFICN
ncbi:conserved exported hypothetical protein [Xenorhabdus innexi]|uniref:SLH domain-containing protein n=2 Tax=Xenorhabdus innexi TaxID=290109 RepID=A0A1N6MV54_9GAMM|nr:hypothetical protein [Xenorhabdus innexi]PHM30035.1 hypothetical protein Xinn_03586 [Xenorhabdus innexi]SIP72736.1 conserved exported hypothetical protein [Xenorhabdus innexi]